MQKVIKSCWCSLPVYFPVGVSTAHCGIFFCCDPIFKDYLKQGGGGCYKLDPCLLALKWPKGEKTAFRKKGHLIQIHRNWGNAE